MLPHLLPLKEQLRYLFVIIISILQQKSWEKAFKYSTFVNFRNIFSLIFHLILFCIRCRNCYAIFEKL